MAPSRSVRRLDRTRSTVASAVTAAAGALVLGLLPVTAQATPSAVQIEAIDWRPGVVNDQTTELYAPVATGGTLVVGLRNASDAPAHVTAVTVDGRTPDQLRADKQLMWWRAAPSQIPAGGVGSVTLDLTTPYRAGRSVTVTVTTDQGSVTVRRTLEDAPLRLSNVTLDRTGKHLLVWVRNDGADTATLPGSIAVDGIDRSVAPSQRRLATGEVAYYRLPAPGSGLLARYVSVDVRPTAGGRTWTLYAHLKVAPSFNASGGYGDASAHAQEQADLGINLVTRGLFPDQAAQQAWDQEFCTKGIKAWLADAGGASDSVLQQQASDPCVAGFTQDEPEWGGTWPFSKNDDYATMQAFADRMVRQSEATGNTAMNYVDLAIGRAIPDFGQIADVAGNDHYAVDTVSSDGDSSHPLQEAGYFSWLTRRAAEPRPSYDWVQYNADIPWTNDSAWNREPTPDEIRLQAYSMLQAGSKSLLWFVYSADLASAYPSLSTEVARLNRESNLIRDMVGEGAEAPGLAQVAGPRIQAAALAGVHGVAVLTTNLDYRYRRVVWNQPNPPSPTPAAAFALRRDVAESVRVPAWLHDVRVVRVDPVTGVHAIPFSRSGDTLRWTLGSLRSTSLVVVVPGRAGVADLRAQWDALTAALPGVDGATTAGPAPPANPAWDDGNPHLKVLWRDRTRDVVVAAPLIRDGVVYSGSRDGALRALRLTDGAAMWRRQLPGSVMSSPVAAGSGVAVTTTSGWVGVVGSDTGRTRWQVQLPAPSQSTPAVVDRRVVVGADDGVVRGYALGTGRATWQRDVGGPVIGGLVPTVVGGTSAVLVPGTDGRVRALAAGDGRVLWARDLGDQVVAAPTVQAGVVYAGTLGGTVQALRLATGARRWAVDVPTPVLRSVGAADGQVLVGLTAYGDCETDGFAGFRALDPRDGSTQWETTGLGCDFGHSAPVFGDGAWFAGTALGTLVRLDPATGQVEGSVLTRGWVLGAPVVVGNRVVLGSDDQSIRVIDTRPPAS